MKILFIVPLSQNSQWENDIIAKQPSCGILYLASYLRKFGHEVSLFERKFSIGSGKRNKEAIEKADKYLYEYLKNTKPRCVGITATTAQVMDAYRCARIVKSFASDIKVILGGHHGSAEPELSLMQCPFIDAVSIGEGEDTILDIANGRDFRKISGIYFVDNGKVVKNENRPVIQDIDSIPLPARDLLNRDFYFSPSSTTVKGILLRGTTVFTQRGCPYSCSFCQNPMFRELNLGKYVRQHSVEYVESEIHHLIDKYNIKAIFFADPTFVINKKRAFELCDMLIRNKLNREIVFEVNLRPDIIDEQILSALKDAGCSNVIYGIESGSSEVLKRMNKGSTIEEGLTAVRLTKKHGISCVANFIIGTPGEKEKEFLATIEFIRQSKPDWVTRHKFYPLPGTPFYKRLVADNKFSPPENWDNLYDSSVVNNFTFADIAPKRFKYLNLVMDRRLVIPTNYMFKIKSNIKKNPFYAFRQFFLMIIHIMVLYLPVFLINKLVRLAEDLKIKSRFVYE